MAEPWDVTDKMLAYLIERADALPAHAANPRAEAELAGRRLNRSLRGQTLAGRERGWRKGLTVLGQSPNSPAWARGTALRWAIAGVSSAHYTDASPIGRQARTDPRRAADSESTHTEQH